MNNTTYMIFTKHNTRFGPYATKEMAQDAKYNLGKYGDSLGIKWHKSELRIAKCKQWEDLNGFISYEEIK